MEGDFIFADILIGSGLGDWTILVRLGSSDLKHQRLGPQAGGVDGTWTTSTWLTKCHKGGTDLFVFLLPYLYHVINNLEPFDPSYPSSPSRTDRPPSRSCPTSFAFTNSPLPHPGLPGLPSLFPASMDASGSSSGWTVDAVVEEAEGGGEEG